MLEDQVSSEIQFIKVVNRTGFSVADEDADVEDPVDPLDESSRSFEECGADFNYCQQVVSDDSNDSAEIIINPEDVQVEIEETPGELEETTGESEQSRRSDFKNIDFGSTLWNFLGSYHQEIQRESFNVVQVVRETDSGLSCQTCGRSFSTIETLKRHMLIHTGANKLTCVFCNKSMSRKDKLKLHIKRFHQNVQIPETKPVKSAVPVVTEVVGTRCSLCEKSFANINSLKRHMEIHSEKKRHQCPICMKYLSRTDHLKRHIAIKHSGETRGFDCQLCNETLSSRYKLEQHCKKVHCDEVMS